MNCKNCGTEIVPGALRCPTCNIEYSTSDALEIPDTPNQAQIDSILIDDIVKTDSPIEENKILEIQPIEMPAFEDVKIPIINEIDTTPVVEKNKNEKFQKSSLLPEERGGNMFFLVIAILLLLSACGFFVYAKFVNPEIINDVIYYFRPDLEKKEEAVFKKVILKYDDLKKYNSEEGSFDYLNELMTLIYYSVEKMEEGSIVVYKETMPHLPVIQDVEKKLSKEFENYTINDTFEIILTEDETSIIINYKNNTKVATGENIATDME